MLRQERNRLRVKCLGALADMINRRWRWLAGVVFVGPLRGGWIWLSSKLARWRSGNNRISLSEPERCKERKGKTGKLTKLEWRGRGQT